MKDLLQDWEQIERENVSRHVAFLVLQPYLPPGTRITSGYRTPQKQLALIRDYAERYNRANPADPISVPLNNNVNDENNWGPSLAQLRKRRFIMNSPLSTPHSSVRAVFDLAGADLKAIDVGCRTAESAKKVVFNQVRLEMENKAVHVDVAFVAPEGVNRFGGASATAPAGTLAEDTKKSEALRRLQESFESEPNPAKKADYLQEMIRFLDPLKDMAAIESLRGRLKEIGQLAQQQESNRTKNSLIEKMSAAMRDEKADEAEDLVRQLEKAFPDDEQTKQSVNLVKTWQLINAAMQILAKGGDDDYLKAETDIDEALVLSPSHSLAKRLKTEINYRRRKARDSSILRVILGTLAVTILLVGLFFAFRPGQLMLHCEDGDQHGESFALDQPEIIIGSLGAPEGEAQIVINDRKRKISRSHCVIKQSGRRFYLKDLDSANGTWVNGRRLEAGEYHELKKGDEISLANAATLIVRRR